jgi:3-oxoacyl-[acyl-carrier-protein] synthase II
MDDVSSDVIRIVVAGVGAITSMGGTAQELWEGVRGGQVAISPVQGFPMDEYQTRIAGEVTSPHKPAYDYAPGSAVREPSLDFGLVAAEEAVAACGLGVTWKVPAERWGVAYGSCNGGWRSAELALRERAEGQHPDWRRYALVSPQAGAEALASAFGLKGPVLSVNTACASSAHALAHAVEAIRSGEADVMLVGGSDAFTEEAFAGFSSLESLSTEPAAPYSRDRHGLSLGEGSGMMVLVAEPVARAAGVRPLAEVLGYGLSADGHHPTAPHPQGAGAARAMAAAIASSGLTPDQVRYVNGHGTGTPKNDSAESNAVRAALGAAAADVALSSTKSMVGHLLGAAGAVEGITTMLGLRDGVLPPTANFTETDPACGLDPVPGTARPLDYPVALSNNFAFGGANASVAYARPDAGVGAPRVAAADRVVVTGVGAFTAAGAGPDALLDAFRAGDRLGTQEDGLRVARCDFDPEAAGSAKARRRMDRLSQLAVAVCREALKDAGLDPQDVQEELEATGVVLGTGVGPVDSNERFTVPVLREGAASANPAVFPSTVHNAAAGQVAMALGTKGPTSTLTSFHGAGAAALAAAYDLLRSGRADRLVVPAVEVLSPGTLDAYRSVPVFGLRSARSAYTLAEGGVALVLERESSARARGARILGVLAGRATAHDAVGLGRWSLRGEGIERAMRGALASAGLRPDQVAAVFANASGLAAVDRPELAAVARLFGPELVPSAPKRILGEPVGAGAQLSAALALTAWRRGEAHGPVLVNSSTLGGTHTCLVLTPLNDSGSESN